MCVGAIEAGKPCGLLVLPIVLARGPIRCIQGQCESVEPTVGNIDMTIRAGAVSKDITPATPVGLFGYPQLKRTANEVHAPLLTSVLHLRSGQGEMILVSLDLLFLDPPTARLIRKSIAEAAGTPEDQIFVACTGTYNAPAMTRLLSWSSDPTVPKPDPAYIERVVKTTVQASSEAAALSRPAELAWATVQAPGRGHIVGPMGIGPVNVFCVRREMGEHGMIASVVISDRAPSFLGRNFHQISPDYPHFVRERLRGSFGESHVTLHFNSPSVMSPGITEADETGVDAAEFFGSAVADSVVRLVAGIRDSEYSASPVLMGKRKTVDLTPIRLLPGLWEAQVRWGEKKAEYQALKEANAEPDALWEQACVLAEAEGTLNLARAVKSGKLMEVLQSYRPIEAQVLRISEMCMAGLPGLMAREYGLAIRNGSSRETFPVSLVNGELQGNIVGPVPEGFGSMNSPFGAEVGEALVQAVIGLVKSI